MCCCVGHLIFPFLSSLVMVLVLLLAWIGLFHNHGCKRQIKGCAAFNQHNCQVPGICPPIYRISHLSNYQQLHLGLCKVSCDLLGSTGTWWLSYQFLHDLWRQRPLLRPRQDVCTFRHDSYHSLHPITVNFKEEDVSEEDSYHSPLYSPSSPICPSLNLKPEVSPYKQADIW